MNSVKLTQNFPIKGINTDTHPSMIGNDYGTELINVRIVGTEGTNLVIVNISGNTHRFTISDGFHVIGMNVYDGILYLVSRSDDDIVEIGSFPSPRKLVYDGVQAGIGSEIAYRRYTIDNVLTGMEMTYKPIVSLGWKNSGGSGVYLGFRTKVFEYDDSVVSIEFKKAFDRTLSLYLVNGKNRNRVVNTCFSDDGSFMEDRIKFIPNGYPFEDTVDSITKQFLSITKPPVGRLQEISSGGELPCGNLFLYMRYLDYEYNSTNFLPLEGPIMITHGDDPYTVHGNDPEKLISKTDKQIKVKLRYLDQSYKFFEIAIVRHTSSDPSAIANKCMLLTKRISLPESGEEMDIVITGKEQFSDIAYEEIIRPVIKETTCQAQLSINNRWWGINWRESNYDRNAMSALARRVYGVPWLNNRTKMYNGNGSMMRDYRYYNKSNVEIDKKSWYQDSFQVLDNVGYFRGEIYPFAVVGLKTDGSLTEAFPITGYDNYVFGNGFNNIQNEWSSDEEAIAYLDNPDNTKCGFIRMPQCGTGDMSLVGSYIDDINYAVMCNLQVKYALQYFEDNSTLFENIKGFYVVRGNRIKNLMAHGIMFGTYNHQDHSYGDEYVGSVFGVPSASGMLSDDDKQMSVNIPLFPQSIYSSFNSSAKGILPCIKNNLDINDFLYEHVEAKSTNNKRALFSPEAAFAKNSIVENEIEHYLYAPYTENMDSNILNGINSFACTLGSFTDHPSGRVSANGKLLATTSDSGDLLYKDNTGSGSSPSPSIGVLPIICHKLLHNHIDSVERNVYNPYIRVSASFVPYNTFSTVGRFSSKMQDIVLGENMNPGFKAWYTVGSDKKYFGNKDIRTPSYLGLDIAPGEEWPGNYLYWKGITFPFMLYKAPNTYYGSGTNYYDAMVSLYSGNDNNLSNIVYYLNNLFVDFATDRTRVGKALPDDVYVSIRDNGIYLPGDCFINRYFFRMVYNGESYSFEDSEKTNSYARTYDYGWMVSIPLMSEINTSVRAIDKTGFYPNWAKDSLPGDENYKIIRYAAYAGGLNRLLGEDHIYDYGHSVLQHKYPVFGIDNTLHEHALHYPGRVRYSDPYISGSYVDGWRNMYYNSKQDFPAELGDAMAIAGYMNNVVLVHENAIIQLNIDTKVPMSEQGLGTEILFGLGTIIDSTFRKLADFGSQHSAIQQGMNGIYGYDYKRSIMWSVALKASATYVYLSAQSISDTIISSTLRKHKTMIDQNVDPDNMYLYNESPLGIVRNGLSFGYDDLNKEVIVTIMGRCYVNASNINGRIILDSIDINEIVWPGYATFYVGGEYVNYPIEDVGDGFIVIGKNDLGESLVMLVELGITYSYSELLTAFTKRSFCSPLYATIDGVIVSHNRLFDDSGSRIWFHNNDAYKCRFYEYNDGFKIGVVINDSKEGLDKFHKMASSCMVPSDQEPFSKVELRSEFQYGEMNPFYNVNKFWILPEYNENTWKINLPVQDSANNEGYTADAQIRGTWIEYMFIYRGTVSKYVGGIISKYIISFN